MMQHHEITDITRMQTVLLFINSIYVVHIITMETLGCGLNKKMYDSRLHIQHPKSGSPQKLATFEAHIIEVAL
jgi:hypothetical protein